MSRVRRDLILDCWLRLLLFVLFLVSEHLAPFERVVYLDKSDLVVPHVSTSYFPVHYLWLTVITVFSLIVLTASTSRSDRLTLLLATTLLGPFNGLLTNIIKLSVGRTRPDFASRCWPNLLNDDDDNRIDEHVFKVDEELKQHLGCTGDPNIIVEGRKSFPSGHSSFAFATFVFLFLVLASKWRLFAQNHTNSLRLVVAILALLPAVLIAVSRTCDYHHHWQDVLVGCLLGSVLAIIVYFHYYPTLWHPECHRPLLSLAKKENNNGDSNQITKLV